MKKIVPKNFKRRLKMCLTLDKDGIRKIIDTFVSQLQGHYVSVSTENYIIVLPAEPMVNIPMVCTHYDTVIHSKKLVTLIESKGELRNVNGILGGDDRCGVAIALELMLEKVNAIFAFFDYEESGGGGSKHFINELPELIHRANCLIGLDRRGSNDAAIYNYRCPSFLSTIASYGYIETDGTFTDVSNIEDQFPKACVNLSVGFYREHTSLEYVNIAHTLATCENLFGIIEEVSGNHYADIEKYDSYGNFGYYGGTGFSPAHWYDDDDEEEYDSDLWEHLHEKDVEEEDDDINLPALVTDYSGGVKLIQRNSFFYLDGQRVPKYLVPKIKDICYGCPDLHLGYGECRQNFECFGDQQPDDEEE